MSLHCRMYLYSLYNNKFQFCSTQGHSWKSSYFKTTWSFSEHLFEVTTFMQVCRKRKQISGGLFKRLIFKEKHKDKHKHKEGDQSKQLPFQPWPSNAMTTSCPTKPKCAVKREVNYRNVGILAAAEAKKGNFETVEHATSAPGHLVLRGIKTGRMLLRTFFCWTDAHLFFVELFANGIVGKSDEDRLTKWPNTSYTSKTERIIVPRMFRLG